MPGGKRKESRGIRVLTRRTMALECRRNGMTYRDIAAKVKKIWKAKFKEELRYTHRAAHKDVQIMLKEMLVKTAETVEQVRELEKQRLDQLFFAVWPRALKGDEKAISNILSIMTRRARLEGLDAKEEIVLTVNDLRRAESYGITPRDILTEAQHLLTGVGGVPGQKVN